MEKSLYDVDATIKIHGIIEVDTKEDALRAAKDLLEYHSFSMIGPGPKNRLTCEFNILSIGHIDVEPKE
jgi:hypothetical protein